MDLEHGTLLSRSSVLKTKSQSYLVNCELIKKKNEGNDDESFENQNIPSFPALINIPIETLFSEKILQRLRSIFDKHSLPLSKFSDVVTDLLQLDSEYARSAIPTLFSAVDTYQKGYIYFTDLCQYLYEDYQRREIWQGELQKITLVLPGMVVVPKVHRPLPVRMLELEEAQLLFSKDGLISIWSNSFKLRKCKSLKTRELEKERHYAKVYCDIAVVETIGKIIVSNIDKEIQFFDLQSLEPYCQIQGLPSAACTLDVRINSQNVLYITFGDWHGCVNVLSISNPSKALRSWSERPKVLGIAAIALEVALAQKEVQMARWKVHEKRVNKVIFTELLGGQVISCSTDSNYALGIGCAFPPFYYGQVGSQNSSSTVTRRPPAEDQTYKIPFGIQTIDIWEEKRFFAASGVDRIIRIWNIMTKGDPVASLLGHFTPIRRIMFYPPVLVSVSSQKSIRIWDLKEFRCIANITALASKMKGQEVLFTHCSRLSNAVVVQTSDDLYAFQFFKNVAEDEDIASHPTRIIGGRYNELLKVWITCSKRTVKVWDVRTGRKKSEFTIGYLRENTVEERINEELRFQAEKAMKKRELQAIQGFKKRVPKVKPKYFPNFVKPMDATCMCVEPMGNRILTGHVNGIVQEFNFVSGMNIRTMCKGKDSKEETYNNSITGVIFAKSALNDNILSVGWDKVIDVYPGGDSKATEPVTSWNCYKGHEDDILCITSTEPNLLVTGSAEGLVILWNFTSGKIEGRLVPPNYEGNADYDMSKVTALSIYKRKYAPDDGSKVMYLFTAGPNSGIQVWEIYWKIRNMYYRGKIRPWRSKTRFFSALAAAPEKKILAAADNIGDVYLFDMQHVKEMQGLRYNPRGVEFNEHLKLQITLMLPELPLKTLGVTTFGMPELKTSWPAHFKGITVLTVCERYGLILTGDQRGKVRIWNLCGHYIGMLGQRTEFDIYNPKTYQHPKVPKDIEGDFSREYEAEQDKKSMTPKFGQESFHEVVDQFEDDSEDYKIPDEEITNRARKMTVFKKVLPDFLKFENCYKVVYRNSPTYQKYSLAYIYKKDFDSDLLKGLPKKDNA